jgi:hypothetical protein
MEVTMSKQTAVEWLLDQFKEYDFSEDDGMYLIKIPSWLLTEKEEQAKQMEKEQIEIAFAKSYLIGCEEVSYNDANKASENYYNETYGGQDESK